MKEKYVTIILDLKGGGEREILDLMEERREKGVGIILSGKLVETLLYENKEYLEKIQYLIHEGILEPILCGWDRPLWTYIPHEDKRGNILWAKYAILEHLLFIPKGIWLDQYFEGELLKEVANSGLNYIVIDKAPLKNIEAKGYFVTEKEGLPLKVLPIDKNSLVDEAMLYERDNLTLYLSIDKEKESITRLSTVLDKIKEAKLNLLLPSEYVDKEENLIGNLYPEYELNTPVKPDRNFETFIYHKTVLFISKKFWHHRKYDENGNIYLNPFLKSLYSAEGVESFTELSKGYTALFEAKRILDSYLGGTEINYVDIDCDFKEEIILDGNWWWFWLKLERGGLPLLLLSKRSYIPLVLWKDRELKGEIVIFGNSEFDLKSKPFELIEAKPDSIKLKANFNLDTPSYAIIEKWYNFMEEASFEINYKISLKENPEPISMKLQINWFLDIEGELSLLDKEEPITLKANLKATTFEIKLLPKALLKKGENGKYLLIWEKLLSPEDKFEASIKIKEIGGDTNR